MALAEVTWAMTRCGEISGNSDSNIVLPSTNKGRPRLREAAHPDRNDSVLVVTWPEGTGQRNGHTVSMRYQRRKVEDGGRESHSRAAVTAEVRSVGIGGGGLCPEKARWYESITVGIRSSVQHVTDSK